MSSSTGGGRILDPKDADALIEQGKDSQKRREEAMKRRREEDEAQKMAEDAGTVSQGRRGRGL